MNRALLLPLLMLTLFAARLSSAAEPTTSEAALTKLNRSNDFATAQNALLKQDQPLRAMAIMEKLGAEQKFMVPVAAQFSAFLGRESLTRKMANLVYSPKQVPDKTIVLSDLVATDAIQAIVAVAATYRVVIINEGHSDQRQRAFAHLLMRALKPQGFTHLGFEAINPGRGDVVNKNGPTLSTAFYTADPVFADFLRNGVALGYTVFDYEPGDDFSALDNAARLSAREKGEAANIKKILDANPTAKALIYVGGGHGAKVPQPQGLKMMALQLMDMVGTDVLSIQQAVGSPQSEPVFDHPLYQAVESALLKRGSTAFRKKDGKWLDLAGYDIVVFHPRLPEEYGRGTWMSMDGYRKREVVNVAALPARTLVRARALPLQKDGIAMDQVLIDAQATEVALYLPVGEYALFRESEAGISEQIGKVAIK